MDFDETVRLLDSVVGTFVTVYPAPESSTGEPPPNFMTGMSICGTLKRVRDTRAAERRRLSEKGDYALDPAGREIDLGDAPLEMYERQIVAYTFEEMDNPRGAEAEFLFWRHEFIESQSIDYGLLIPAQWLWIQVRPLGYIVLAEFDSV